MQNKIFRKGLVVGIIVLFIGIGIQPGLSNEVNIPTISDNEEDCNCDYFNDLQRVRIKSLLYLILLKYRHNPEVSERSKQLLDNINSGSWYGFCLAFYQFIESMEFFLRFWGVMLLLLYWVWTALCWPFILE